MSLIRWDPLRDVLSLRQAMDRLFEESFVRPRDAWPLSRAAGLTVAVDMHETDDELVLTADLPGLKPEDVDIGITENTLTMRGEFRSEDEGERGNVHFQERRYGSFQRSLALPAPIDADAAEAEFKDGVLTIMLPKTEETRPKQVKVKARS
jgi:HSP20 family protein